MQTRKTIVILGAGFAGVRAAQDLARRVGDTHEIILVNDRSYHQYHPAFYEVASARRADATALALKQTAAVSLGELFSDLPAGIVQDRVVGINFAKKTVQLANSSLSFDFLIVSLGSREDYYDIPGLKEHAHSFKNLTDAIRIRNKIEDLVCTAATSKKPEMRVVIGGGGFTGVELAAELRHFYKHLCTVYQYPLVNVKTTIIEGCERVLATSDPYVSKMAQKRLTHLGVSLKLGSFIQDVQARELVISSGEKIPFDVLVWCGGVRACAIGGESLPACDKRGRFLVDGHLEIPNHPNVFAAGDVACVQDPKTKTPLPGLAQLAMDQGAYVAKVIAKRLHGITKEIAPYRPRQYGFIVPVGGKYAIMHLPRRMTVFPAGTVMAGPHVWLLRRFVDLHYFATVLPFGRALKLWIQENVIYTKND
jgi:NADH dehydrogenase